ncbi:hypothetical protein ACFO3J_24100 [Streptomyces polygonati]|uniref:Minor tail protein n=1 Tax=Streptomyces polygonati TaxID=1617087 RepID=A0ABV8HR72_9ACTN
MAFAENPLWINALSYSGAQMRHAEAMILAATGTAGGVGGGVRPGDPGLLVTLTGMAGSVASGVAAVPGLSGQGLYRAYTASTSTFTVSTAHASLTRIDLVYLRVWDNAADGSGLTQADVVYLAGTAGSGTAPTPAGTQLYIPLATVTVPPGSTTPSVADARPAAVAPGGIAPVASAALPTAGLYIGHARYNLVRGMIETWNGSAWVAQGDWVTYTPTWTAATTNPTLGGGATLTGRYSLVGKLCTAKIELATSSNTLFGSGVYAWAIPFASSANGTGVSMGAGHGINASGRWDLQGLVTSVQSIMNVWTPSASGDCRLVSLASGQGMGGVAWATAQTMRVQVEYEIA